MIETFYLVVAELVNTDIYFYKASDVIGHFLFAMFIELFNTV